MKKSNVSEAVGLDAGGFCGRGLGRSSMPVVPWPRSRRPVTTPPWSGVRAEPPAAELPSRRSVRAAHPCGGAPVADRGVRVGMRAAVPPLALKVVRVGPPAVGG